MPKQKIDCLLIHVPKDESEEFAFGMIMPMGLFALADALNRNGYISRIIHIGVEKIRNNTFSIEDYLKDKEVLLIGVSLHWYFQSHDTIQLINRIKLSRMEIKIVLGGFTASFFSEEIIRYFGNVDFVIRGDGELPLLNLMKELYKKRPDFSLVPNMVWRNSNKIIKNAHSYVATSQDLDKLNFTNFGLMENFALYRSVGLGEVHYFYNPKTLNNQKSFPLSIGRGCRLNCSYCGGAKLSQRLINNRREVVFRSPEKVLESLKDIVEAGYEEVFICFEPYNDYFRKVFALIKKSKIRIRMNFNCQFLPDKDFIDEFKDTFEDGSAINLSPETGSEKLRKLNKGLFYTNDELIGVLDYLKKINLSAIIYFCYPLPFSTKNDIKITDRLINFIKKNFGERHRVIMHELSPDPGSPMYIFPEKFKMIRKISSFLDYYMLQDRPAYIPERMSEKGFISMFKEWRDREDAIHRLIPKGFAYADIEKYDKAIEQANKALRLAPEEREAYFLLAYSYRKKKKYRVAIENIKKAEKINPKDPRVNFLLSCYYKDIGRIKMFREEIDKGCIKLGKIDG